MADINNLLSIAPMIDWTYSHFRVLMRILAPKALLYTEMQTVGAINYNQQRALEYLAVEKPLALQLGGSAAGELARCAKIAEEQGFDEVNLNLGCPSDRVQSGQFGACLMKNPKLVVECIRAMKRVVNIPVTAKVRIGVDENDGYEYFADFSCQLKNAGIDKLIVHARKAWLNGLSPKQNRTVPPLHYDYAYRIKEVFGEIPVVINGNINTAEDVMEHLKFVDGVMIGRLACQNPYLIAKIHHDLYPEVALISRATVMSRYLSHLKSAHALGTPLSFLLKPIFNMAHGLPGARSWREELSLLQRVGDVDSIEQLVNDVFLKEDSIIY